MRHYVMRFILPIILLSTMLHSCMLARLGPTASPGSNATLTIEAAASLVAMLQQPPATRVPNTPIVITPLPSSTPQDTATPSAYHLDKPGEPPMHTSDMSDRSSAILADENRTVGDHFDFNLYERPMTAEEMSYKPYLDIAPGAELSLAPPWVYVTIFLVSLPPSGVEVSYAVELDLNADGRGDWLITAADPTSSEWTTKGVSAYLDSNGDVGGRLPGRADDQPGDGFEIPIFDRGSGPDPDAAWVRLNTNLNAVQIAIKHTLIGEDRTFVWGAWADSGVMRPDWYDYNDHFSIAEAGSPNLASRYYPVKALALIDNTCRWIQGIVPRVGMVGSCNFGK